MSISSPGFWALLIISAVILRLLSVKAVQLLSKNREAEKKAQQINDEVIIAGFDHLDDKQLGEFLLALEPFTSAFELALYEMICRSQGVSHPREEDNMYWAYETFFKEGFQYLPKSYLLRIWSSTHDKRIRSMAESQIEYIKHWGHAQAIAANERYFGSAR